ncbi:hypothetical protein [Bradyrhizobium sp. Tv2a-2]|nr:hypothetical protein [Bradyrhizobium sp. Tv2a-2]
MSSELRAAFRDGKNRQLLRDELRQSEFYRTSISSGSAMTDDKDKN